MRPRWSKGTRSGYSRDSIWAIASSASSLTYRQPGFTRSSSWAECSRRSTYRPRHARESEEAYSERLQRSFHFNDFESALDTLAEMPFTKPVPLADSAPEELHASPAHRR